MLSRWVSGNYSKVKRIFFYLLNLNFVLWFNKMPRMRWCRMPGPRSGQREVCEWKWLNPFDVGESHSKDFFDVDRLEVRKLMTPMIKCNLSSLISCKWKNTSLFFFLGKSPVSSKVSELLWIITFQKGIFITLRIEPKCQKTIRAMTAFEVKPVRLILPL